MTWDDAGLPHGNYTIEQLCPECVENDGSHSRSALNKVHLKPKMIKQEEVREDEEVAEPLAAKVLYGVKTLGRLVSLIFQTLY